MSEEKTDVWWVEIESFSFDDAAFRAAECAELAEELDLYRVQALADNGFEQSLYDWDCYVVENSLWLPLEQSCHDGVLLPMDQRALRVKTCPEDVLSKLRWFFEICPAHIKHHLALMYYVAVRVDRARRTGSPEWRPATADLLPPVQYSVFFRPPLLTVRKYGR
jgi:hypothetical protein